MGLPYYFWRVSFQFLSIFEPLDYTPYRLNCINKLIYEGLIQLRDAEGCLKA